MTNEASSVYASRCVPGCPPRNRLPNGEHTDPAKRGADEINLHIAAKGAAACGKWVAIALADGSSDHVLYDTKPDAARHQLDEFLCAYFRVPRQYVNLCEVESFLRTNRIYYDNGMRMTDPREVIRPLTREAHQKQMRQLEESVLMRGGDLSRYLNNP